MANQQDLSHHLKLRTLSMDDYQDVKEIMDKVYRSIGGSWTKAEYKRLLTRYPEGQICIEDNGKVVAVALGLIVNYAKFGDRHTYYQITGNGTFNTHNPEGDIYYGIDMMVHPDYRNLRLGRRLYDARKELCENMNLRGIITGGRIPFYHKYADQYTPRQYIEQVKNKEIYDPILTFQLNNEFHVKRVLQHYLPEDDASRSYAVLLEWTNIYFEEEDVVMGGTQQDVRLGVVQWQMRKVDTLEDWVNQAEFFVDAVSGYQADFVIFPEFFNAPLMAPYNEESPSAAIRHLAGFTEDVRERMLELAVSYNINIIAGSMPYYDGEKLNNISYLCRRDGTWEAQYKLHITPDETSYWGVQGGDKVKVFDTDSGKIGILVCYDVEFPELSRIMAEEGMQILFVPFLTDTQTAFLRVMRCAQARAIENECYVAISGSVGNLPSVENMDIQYAQSAVFSPCDFAFPHDGVIAQSTPNTEMTLIADLDMNSLLELRTKGSVRNSKERRTDLYSINWKKKAREEEEEDHKPQEENKVVRESEE